MVRNGTILSIRCWLVVAFSLLTSIALRSAQAAAPAAAPDDEAPQYVLQGHLAEMRSKGTIRFLVYGEADYLPRNGDPSGAE
jgi:hypothetical protein